MKDEKGWIFLEAMVSLSIVLMTVTLLLPAIVNIKAERSNQSLALTIAYELQSRLHQLSFNPDKLLPYELEKRIGQRQVTFTFNYREELIQGCASWRNHNDKKEKFCLYSLSE